VKALLSLWHQCLWVGPLHNSAAWHGQTVSRLPTRTAPLDLQHAHCVVPPAVGVQLCVCVQGWRLDVPSMPRLSEVAAWRGTRPAAAAAPAGSTGSSEQQQQQRGESPMSESPPSPPSNSNQQQQQQQPPSAQQQQQQQQDDRRDPSSVLGRPPPSAAIYHGGYYTQEDVAQVRHMGRGRHPGPLAGGQKSQAANWCLATRQLRRSTWLGVSICAQQTYVWCDTVLLVCVTV
jgi:hypothetical protein